MKRVLIYLSLIIFLVSRISSTIGIEPAKYLRFMMVLPLLLIPFSKFEYQKKTISSRYLNSVCIFTILLICISILQVGFKFSFGYRNVVTSVLVFTPVISAKIIADFSTKDEIIRYLKIIFSGFIIVYILELYVRGVNPINSIFHLKDALISSIIDTESGVSLIFCFYTLFFFQIKNNKLFFLALFLTVLSFKRIALLGLFISMVYYLFISRKRSFSRNKQIIHTFIGIVSFCLVIFTFNFIVSDYFNSLFNSLTGLDFNRFIMGRTNRYCLVIDHYPRVSIIGAGVGDIENYLIKTLGFFQNFHSDILKNYYEFGTVMFLVWSYLIWKYAAFSAQTYSILILLSILMLSDNVFIYIRVMLIFYLMNSYFLKDFQVDEKNSMKLILNEI